MNITGVYTVREYNPVTNRYKETTTLNNCDECKAPMVDVVEVIEKQRLKSYHKDCYKVKFSVKNIKEYYSDVCKQKIYKNNQWTAREMVENMDYHHRNEFLEKVGWKAIKKMKKGGDIVCELSRELLKAAVAEGFNFYYQDLKDFYKEEAYVNGE